MVRQNRRPGVQIFLIVLSAILFIAFAIFLILSVILLVERSNKTNSETGDTGRICLTLSCVKTASTIIQTANLKVDPCTDFYEFACGSWIENTRIPDDKAEVQILLQPAIKLDYDLRAILETPSSSDAPWFEKNLKNVYASCMDTDEIEKRGAEPMMDLLNKYGGWPVITEKWNDSTDLTRLLSKIKFVGRPLLSLERFANTSDTRKWTVRASQGDLTIDRSFYLNQKHVNVIDVLKKYVYEVSEAFGTVNNRSLFEKDVIDIMAFERSLASIYVPAVDLNIESDYKTATIKEISDMFGSEFDFKSYILSIFKEANIDLTGNDVIYLAGSSYFEKLPQLLRDTPKRVVVNYIFWRIVDQHIIIMPKKFLEINQQKKRALTGVLQELPRWQTCVAVTNAMYGLQMSSLYVERHFDNRTRYVVQEMVGELKQSLLTVIDQVPWMSQETKETAKDKAKHIKEFVGYPDYILDKAKLNSIFDDKLIMTPNEYLKNLLQTKYIVQIATFKALREPVDKSEWPIAPAVINAVYESTTNSITFPAAILQKPVYNPDYPKSISYGGLGSIIGHELTHGFDTLGSQYDKDGNLRRWWPEKDQTAFTDQTPCMVEQYNKYVIPEINDTINGKLTLSENIADNGGVKEAFMAYRNWAEKNDEEYLLPGLPYNPYQLFFIGYAQVWCELKTPAMAMSLLLTDPHSPGRFRVIGPLSNLKEFSEVFNCPTGSPMNPPKKCSVW